MATPKNKKSYKYSGKKRICFKPKKGPRVCFTGRERVPTGAGAPEHGGTACRAAGGKFKACAGGPRRGPRQAGLFETAGRRVHPVSGWTHDGLVYHATFGKTKVHIMPGRPGGKTAPWWVYVVRGARHEALLPDGRIVPAYTTNFTGRDALVRRHEWALFSKLSNAKAAVERAELR